MSPVTKAGPEHQAAPGEEQKVGKVATVLDLVHGDHSLERKILRRVKAKDAPVLFQWDDTNLEAFWTRAVAYGAVANAHAPPINGGAHLVGEATPATTLLLKQWILS
jgi:hypothetical protein